MNLKTSSRSNESITISRRNSYNIAKNSITALKTENKHHSLEFETKKKSKIEIGGEIGGPDTWCRICRT